MSRCPPPSQAASAPGARKEGHTTANIAASVATRIEAATTWAKRPVGARELMRALAARRDQVGPLGGEQEPRRHAPRTRPFAGEPWSGARSATQAGATRPNIRASVPSVASGFQAKARHTSPWISASTARAAARGARDSGTTDAARRVARPARGKPRRARQPAPALRSRPRAAPRAGRRAARVARSTVLEPSEPGRSEHDQQDHARAAHRQGQDHREQHAPHPTRWTAESPITWSTRCQSRLKSPPISGINPNSEALCA